MVRPAMIDSTSVDLPTCRPSGGTASGAVCGLTAMTMAAAASALALDRTSD